MEGRFGALFLWPTNKRRGCEALGLHEFGLIAVSAKALVSPCWASPFWQSPGWRAPPKGTKKSCPCIRPRLRRGSLAPVTFQGPAATGHPWPNAALAASMPLNPFHATCARTPERGDLAASDGPCNELVVRASRDRRVANAKLTHRFWWARSDINCGIDCGGKCFAVFHPTRFSFLFGT